jgi:hypothetical protein
MCGVRPTAEDVEAFLNIILTGSFRAVPLQQTNVAQTGLAEVAGHITQDSKATKAQRAAVIAVDKNVDYTLFGQPQHAASAIEALVDILRKLSFNSPRFLPALSEKAKARTRNHVAASKEDVYPQKPDLMGYTTEIIPGWWLGTNIANREKVRILKQACEVAGLKYGKDLVISLPNVT